jgi:hypothetical protein
VSLICLTYIIRYLHHVKAIFISKIYQEVMSDSPDSPTIVSTLAIHGTSVVGMGYQALGLGNKRKKRLPRVLMILEDGMSASLGEERRLKQPAM